MELLSTINVNHIPDHNSRVIGCESIIEVTSLGSNRKQDTDPSPQIPVPCSRMVKPPNGRAIDLKS